jgi:hypothetical protein
MKIYCETVRKLSLQWLLISNKPTGKHEWHYMTGWSRVIKKNWRAREGCREKHMKKHKEGYIALIMVPPTLKSELLNMMREVAEKDSDDGLRRNS